LKREINKKTKKRTYGEGFFLVEGAPRLEEIEVVARPSLVRGRSRIRDLAPDISECKAKESAKESSDEDRKRGREKKGAQ
jgi:hypothetical protein